MKEDKKILYNAVNERIKYKYRIHLKRLGRKDEKTIIEIMKHLRGFEAFINFGGFSCYNETIADKYINYLLRGDFSLSYIDNGLRVLKTFLQWLERQRGYKSKINYNHIDYLSLSNNQRKTAKATEYKQSYQYEQILKTIRQMPEKTIMDKRNKAIISVQALCGFRVSELRTIKIKNLIQEEGVYFIHANPKDMKIKYAKTRQANFMPIPELINNILNWKDYLIKQGFKPEQPLFPQISNSFNQHNLLETNLTANEIKSNTTIRDVFRKAFESAGFEYIRPHNFRHTITRYAEKQTPEFFNAVRQSLGHNSIDTTFNSYGQLSSSEQTKRFASAKIDFIQRPENKL